jgi:hypothetical protein
MLFVPKGGAGSKRARELKLSYICQPYVILSHTLIPHQSLCPSIKITPSTNGIQTDREIQNPISGPKFTTNTPDFFAVLN